MIRFKECRLAAGLQQKTVAIELGVKPPSVSDWEKGRNLPTVENLLALAKLYGVSTDQLLGLDDEIPERAKGPEEAELLSIYRQLNVIGRATLLTTAAGMLSQPGLRQAGSIASEG